MRVMMTIAITALLTSPAVAGQQDKDAKPPKEKKICRSEQTTGSYLPKRTCHTAEEWKAIDGTNADDARATLDQAQRQTAGSSMR
ncbi:MAG: hypothetical protein ACTHKR_06490 [Sphingomonas sp.]